MPLNKAQLRKIEIDRIEHELENCNHYLNGIRNNHEVSYQELVRTLEELLVAVRRLDGFS